VRTVIRKHFCEMVLCYRGHVLDVLKLMKYIQDGKLAFESGHFKTVEYIESVKLAYGSRINGHADWLA